MFTRRVDDELELALVQHSFAPLYEQLVKDNERYLLQWLPWPAYCKTAADFSVFITESLHKYAEGTALNLGMVVKGQLVGNISFNTINRSLKKVEIGYWLIESMQGQGIVTRACRHLIHMAFNELGMEKIQISAATENKPSRSVCERLGMQLEGIITHAENINGRIVDHAIYGLKRNLG